MKDYKFIDINALKNTEINEVVNLLLETGYYEFISLGNKLNLPTIEFQKIQTLQAYTNYTHTLVSSDNKIIGFFIAITNQQMLQVEKNIINWYRESDELTNFFEQLTHFYVHETLQSDFILYGIAIHPLWQKKGFFKVLYSKLSDLAYEHNCLRIIFTIWQSNPALDIYLHYGARIIGKLDFSKTGFNDNLIKCYFKL